MSVEVERLANLASEVCCTTLRGLQDDGRLLVSGSLEGCYNSGGGGNIDGWDSEVVLLSIVEKVQPSHSQRSRTLPDVFWSLHIIANDHTSLTLEDFLCTHFEFRDL